MEKKKYISEAQAMIAVQNVLMDLGYEPLGDDAQKFYQALEDVEDYIEK